MDLWFSEFAIGGMWHTATGMGNSGGEVTDQTGLRT